MSKFCLFPGAYFASLGEFSILKAAVLLAMSITCTGTVFCNLRIYSFFSRLCCIW